MRKGILLFISTTFLFASCSEEEKPSTENPETSSEESTKVDVKQDGNTTTLSFANRSISLDAKPGGRISSMKIDNKEFLSLSDVNPDNWGSTLWTSPQAEWGWPPPAAYDLVEYQVSIEGESIVATNANDTIKPFQFKKTISFDGKDSAFVIRYEITNSSDSTKMVAPWEVQRIPPNGLTFFPGSKDNYTAPYTTVDSIGHVWFDYKNSQIQEGHAKLVGRPDAGWVAHVQGEYILIKSFEFSSEIRPAENEGEIEIYANPDKSYIEIEPQGPYTSLAPGSSSSWEVSWLVRKLPANVNISAGSQELIDYVKRTTENQ